MKRKLKLSTYTQNVCDAMVTQFGDNKVEAPAMLEICGVARSTTVKEMNQTELLQYVIAMGVSDNRRLMAIVEQRESELNAFLSRNRASRRHG